uniref:Uncharacterized protein n=1 Tax=Graphocephala atropunctata TaxID=36148 RepID=A0A1B6LWH7_9HEMI
MELAITELEESYKNNVNRVNDVEWKIEQIQQFKNSNCDSIVKLLEKVDALKKSSEKYSEEFSVVNNDLDKNIINFRNSYRYLETQTNILKRNIESLKTNSNTE